MSDTLWLLDLGWLDIGALSVLLLAWAGSSWWIEHGPRSGDGISAVMNDKRAEWMTRAAGREHRIMDAALLTTLQNGASFFASTTLLAAGGTLALIAETDQVVRVVQDLPIGDETPNAAAYEAKLLLVLVLIVNAFLKFAWAQRLFSYCAVLIGAIPNLEGVAAAPEAERLRCGAQAAAVLTQAGLSFNRGLRTVYFALAALAWLIGPLALLIATAAITRLIWLREFKSKSREMILGLDGGAK